MSSEKDVNVEKGLEIIRKAKKDLQESGASEELAENIVYLALKRTTKG